MLPRRLAPGWRVLGVRVRPSLHKPGEFYSQCSEWGLPTTWCKISSVCLSVELTVSKSPFGMLVCTPDLVAWTSGEVVHENGQSSIGESRRPVALAVPIERVVGVRREKDGSPGDERGMVVAWSSNVLQRLVRCDNLLGRMSRFGCRREGQKCSLFESGRLGVSAWQCC